MPLNVEELRYPIGRFQVPAGVEEGHIQAWIRDIEALPGDLQQRVEPLSDTLWFSIQSAPQLAQEKTMSDDPKKTDWSEVNDLATGRNLPDVVPANPRAVMVPEAESVKGIVQQLKEQRIKRRAAGQGPREKLQAFNWRSLPISYRKQQR